MTKVRVLIADDQEMVRVGFRMILENQPDIEVVADVPDGITAVAKARELRPDVCLVDIRMPGIDGLEVTRQLAGRGVAEAVKVVVVTTFDLDEYVTRRWRTGPAASCSRTPGRRCWWRRCGRRPPATP